MVVGMKDGNGWNYHIYLKWSFHTNVKTYQSTKNVGHCFKLSRGNVQQRGGLWPPSYIYRVLIIISNVYKWCWILLSNYEIPVIIKEFFCHYKLQFHATDLLPTGISQVKQVSSVYALEIEIRSCRVQCPAPVSSPLSRSLVWFRV